MLINKVQSNNPQSFGAFIILKNKYNKDIEKNIGKDTLLHMQQAGEILGSQNEKNSTKYYDVILDYRDCTHPYAELKMRMNPKAWFAPLRFKNVTAYSPAPDTLDLWTTSSIGGVALHRRNDNLVTASMVSDSSIKLSLADLVDFAKIAKIMDEVSKDNNSGINIFNRSRILPEPATPKIKKAMTFTELLQKYGVDA